uniref:Uncharacterized protein n=1 Tax=Avena sativa TaxID=4498 RepID=A0ACD5WMJ7_AVESA
MKSLKFIALRNCRGLESYSFVVHIVDDGGAYRSNNIVQLEDVNCRELQISCLEKLDSLEEARRIRLVEKQNVEILKLCWSFGARRGSLKVEENALLGELVPPHSLQSIELHGYGGETCRPAWWIPSISSHLSNLKDITMDNFPSCTILPPLGLIPNLQCLVLRGMPSITRIDIGELTGGSREPFSQLSKFTVDDMKNLREFNSGGQELDATCYTGGEEFMGFIFRPWKKFNAHHLGRDAHSPGEEFMDSLEEFDTTCYSDEKDEFMFPVIDELVIKKCPELSFGPLPPRAQRLLLSDCQQVMSSWRNRGGVEEGSCAPVTTELVVKRCNVPPSRPSLLHHLPGLRTLIFSHCDNMTSLPEDLGDLKSLQDLKIVCCKQLNNLPDSMKQLSSLQSIHFSECERIGAFPQWFKHLTSLMLLTIDRCPAIESLPQSISELPNLKGLNISGCPRLKIWCELDQNKNKLAHIGLNFGDIGTSSSGSITSANALTPG